MKILRIVAIGAFSVAGVIVACSSDGSSPSTSATTEAGAPDGATGDATASSPLPPPPLDDGSAPPPPPTSCGSATCTSATYKNVIPLAACCASGNRCGLDLTPLTAIRTAPAGCTPLAAPGRNDQCSGLVVGPESDGGDSTVYQGCCRPDDTCGIRIDLGGGLDFGCQPADAFVADAGDAGTCSSDASTD